MSRYIELFAGGSNGFAIKDIDGFRKWKESLDELSQFLHEEKRDKELYVYVGIRWEKEDLDELDTSFNHFNPADGGEEQVIEFWAGLSLFTKEPIELFQTDEEFPFLTKVFGHNEDDESGMFRVYAKDGDVTIQALGFKVLKTEKYKAKDVIDEEIYEAITSKEKKFCDKCKTELNLAKFKFQNRGYYEEIKEKHKFSNLCETCYSELKKPFAEIKKLQTEIISKEKEIERIAKEGK